MLNVVEPRQVLFQFLERPKAIVKQCVIHAEC